MSFIYYDGEMGSGNEEVALTKTGPCLISGLPLLHTPTAF